MDFGEQLQNILDAINRSGWSVKVQSRDTSHMPVDILAANNEQTVNLRIYTWAIVKSGREGERKINWRYLPETAAQQPSDDSLKIALRKKGYTLLIGQTSELGVLLFALFDPFIHRQHGESSPVQIKLDTLKKAKSLGFAQQHKNTGDITIVFPAEDLMGVLLGLYDVVFKNKNKSVLASKISEVTDSEDPVKPEDIFPDLTPRQRIAALRALRNPSFRRRVLKAYHNTCAVCGTNLDFVIAAHLISVGQGGSDETRNGIALCPNHHESFDMGLLGFSQNYEVVLNKAQMKIMVGKGQKSSLTAFLSNIQPCISLPKSKSLWPPPEYLKKALEERGMTDCASLSSSPLDNL